MVYNTLSFDVNSTILKEFSVSIALQTTQCIDNFQNNKTGLVYIEDDKVEDLDECLEAEMITLYQVFDDANQTSRCALVETSFSGLEDCVQYICGASICDDKQFIQVTQEIGGTLGCKDIYNNLCVRSFDQEDNENEDEEKPIVGNLSLMDLLVIVGSVVSLVILLQCIAISYFLCNNNRYPQPIGLGTNSIDSRNSDAFPAFVVYKYM